MSYSCGGVAGVNATYPPSHRARVIGRGAVALSDPDPLNDLRSDVERKLMDGETVLLIEQPQPHRFRWEIWGELGLGLCLAVPTLVFSMVVLAVLIARREWMALLGLPVLGVFWWHVVNYLGAPWRYRRTLGRTIYVVTDRRALVFNGFGYSPQRNLCDLNGDEQSFAPMVIADRVIKRRRRDGAGDVVFAGEWRDSGRQRHYVEFGFFGIKNINQVDELLSQLFPKKTKTDSGMEEGY